MTNKNPFEIRADMLKLAKDYMDKQYETNIAVAEKMTDIGEKTLEDIRETYKMYSTEELMAKAKEMYSFVSTKD